MGEELWIVKQGTVSVIVDGMERTLLGKSDYWGDGALVRKHPSPATLEALGTEDGGRLEVLKLSRSSFEELGMNKMVKFPKRAAIYNGRRKGSSPGKSSPSNSRGPRRERSESSINSSIYRIPGGSEPENPPTAEEEAFIAEALQANVNLAEYLQVSEDVLLNHMAKKAERVTVKAGATISRYGEYSDFMGVIHTGYVDVQLGSGGDRGTNSLSKTMVNQEQELQDLLLATLQVRGSYTDMGALTSQLSPSQRAEQDEDDLPRRSCLSSALVEAKNSDWETPCAEALSRSASAQFGRQTSSGSSKASSRQGSKQAPPEVGRVVSSQSWDRQVSLESLQEWNKQVSWDRQTSGFSMAPERGASGSPRKSVVHGLGPGDILGELSLLFNTGRVATFKASADADVELFHISREVFKKCFYQKRPELQQWYDLLDDVQMFSSLFTFQRQELARNALGYHTYQPNEKVVEKGKAREDRLMCLYVIASGSALLTYNTADDDGLRKKVDSSTDITNSTEVQREGSRVRFTSDMQSNDMERSSSKKAPDQVELYRAETFGERSLAGGERIPENDVIAGDKGLVCISIHGHVFHNMGLHVEDLVNTIVHQHAVEAPDEPTKQSDEAVRRGSVTTPRGPDYMKLKRQTTKRARNSMYLACNAEVDPTNLRNLAFLGRGAFGLVVLQEDPDSGKMYALKRMSKGLIQERGAEKHISAERDLMSLLVNPFICRLRASYKDDQFLYMVQDAMLGGTLDDVIYHHREMINQYCCKFYAASMIEALEYLHGLHIAYRDLKPENVLLDGQGYAKLCDFGFARFAVNPTHTMCGSPEYMAPEIVDPKARQRGYNECVDWWSFGIVTYEMTAGQVPFHDEDDDGDFDYLALLKLQKAGVPANALPHGSPVSAFTFLQQLLTVDPTKRLGFQGADDVRKHPWLIDFDFPAFRKFTLESPLRPEACVPDAPAPQLWDACGNPVEVLVTQQKNTILTEGGDRFRNTLTIDQATGFGKGMSSRDFKEGKEEWCRGFTCEDPSQPMQAVTCYFKTHTCAEEQEGWSAYNMHTDLFVRYVPPANSPDEFKNFQLPASAAVRKSMDNKKKRGKKNNSSMIEKVESLKSKWFSSSTLLPWRTYKSEGT